MHDVIPKLGCDFDLQLFDPVGIEFQNRTAIKINDMVVMLFCCGLEPCAAFVEFMPVNDTLPLKYA